MNVSELTKDEKNCIMECFKECDYFDYYTWMNDDLYDVLIELLDYWLVRRELKGDDYKFIITAQWKKIRYDINHPRKAWWDKNFTFSNVLVFLTLVISIVSIVFQVIIK